MQIEIERLERALIILSDAIEDGRIDGISNEIRDLLNYSIPQDEKTSKLLGLIKNKELIEETFNSFCLSGKITTIHADQIKESLFLFKDKISDELNSKLESFDGCFQLTHDAHRVWRANGVEGSTAKEAIENYYKKIN